MTTRMRIAFLATVLFVFWSHASAEEKSNCPPATTGSVQLSECESWNNNDNGINKNGDNNYDNTKNEPTNPKPKCPHAPMEANDKSDCVNWN